MLAYISEIKRLGGSETMHVKKYKKNNHYFTVRHVEKAVAISRLVVCAFFSFGTKATKFS